MSDAALTELRSLRETVAALVAALSPWITTEQMCTRYGCTPRTLNNMERDGRIPFRTSRGWSRAAVMERESKLP